MTHSEKIKRLYEQVPAMGISPYTVAPIAYRVLWRLGVNISPPLFMGFWPLALFLGTAFSICLCIIMLASYLSHPDPDAVMAALVSSIVAGALFGPITAGYFRYKAKQLNLPSWSQYTGQ